MDNFDIQILSKLLNNCRESDRQIGIDLGMSGGAVNARIRKMQKLEIIEEFYIKVEPPVLGYGILYFVISGENMKEILDSLIIDKPIKPGSFRGRKNTAQEKTLKTNGEKHA